MLLQSLGLESPKTAGVSIGLLQKDGACALTALADQLKPVEDPAAVLAALDALRAEAA